MPSLRHLQQTQPWSVPYSNEFYQSQKENSARQIGHDLLHVMKAVGRMAAEAERADHQGEGTICPEVFDANLPDLVICAMHIASRLNIDLENIVVNTMERYNGVKIPTEE